MSRSDRAAPAHRPPRLFVRASRLQLESGPPRAELDSDAVYYLRHVLRLGQGAKLLLFDGSGREYLAEVTESRPNRVELKILSTARPEVESPLRLTLAQALLKGNAFDRVLTDATELGAHAVVPVLSARTVPQARSREAEAKLKRWQKILEAAAAQSGRVLVPRIEYPISLEEFIRRDCKGQKLVLWEGAGPGAGLPEKCDQEIALLVGPEGGFEENEVQAALAQGFRVWSLGPRILRADTAGPAALAVLQDRFGDGRRA
jgi:16S rRNA (uracil1498-N3)-methyltransferase